MTAWVLLAALDARQVIGVDQRLPWHLPEDMRHFKEITMGRPIVMGRNTFESIGRALPGRLNVVLSHQSLSLPEGVLLVHHLDEIQACLKRHDKAYVIGGHALFRLFEPLANAMCLTHIELSVECGDVFFPEVDPRVWLVCASRRQRARCGIFYRITSYQRRSSPWNPLV